MDRFECLICDWTGTPKPVWDQKDGGIEFLHLQPGGFKPLLYTLEVVMNGIDLMRIGNFETQQKAQGMAIWAHSQGWHSRVRPVRDFFAADETDPNLFAGSRDYFVPARHS
jgi:hypothetical protein